VWDVTLCSLHYREKKKKKNDMEVASQEGEFGRSTAVWVITVHLSFQVLLFFED
jgi:hypothetical protein